MALDIPTDLDFLAANIHGRRSRLAEAERLDELCRIRSLPEFAKAVFPESRFLTAAHLERLIVLDQVEELSEIASKIGGSSGAFLQWLRVRFQMENLKVLARGFLAGMSVRELEPHMVPLPPDLALNTRVLAGAGSIEAFAGVCPNEALRLGLERAIPLHNKNPRPFFVEAGLDHGYLKELIARARALPRSDRQDVLGIARQEADTFHLALAARGRFSYGLKPEVLKPFHVPGSNLNPQAFNRMVAAESLSQVASYAVGAAIDTLPPGADAQRDPDPATIEALAWERYLRLANQTFRRSHMGLGAVVAYASIRRVELANLIRICEGIRAGLDQKSIRRHLIPRPEFSGLRAASAGGSRV